MTQQEALAQIGVLVSEMTNAQDLLDQNWENDIRYYEEVLRQEKIARRDRANQEGKNAMAIDGLTTLAGYIPGFDYILSSLESFYDSEGDVVTAVPGSLARTKVSKKIFSRVPSGPLMLLSMGVSGFESVSSEMSIPLPIVDETFGSVDDLRATAEAGLRVPYELGVHPAQAHVSMEHLYSQTWVESSDKYDGKFQPTATPYYADILRARESLGLMPHARIRELREDFPELPYEASESYSEWILRNKTIVDSGMKTWEEVLIDQALSPGYTFADVGGSRMFRSDLVDLDQAEFLYFPPGGATVGTQFPDAGHEWSREAGPIWDPAYGVGFSEFGQAADAMEDFRNTSVRAEYELDLLQSEFGYARDGAVDFTVATDGLTLSTETAEQALLAAGLSGTAVTQVLDIMRQTGLDPTTIAWGELEAAVHAWGDATGEEVAQAIDNLNKLRDAQAAARTPAGSGSSSSGGSGGGGGTDDRTQRALDQLIALAGRVAVSRAEMDDLDPAYIAHELGKLPGQLRGPGSLEEQLALLRAFFAGSAHGISFGLGPSADQLGFNIPQFAGGGTVPGPLGAPQLIVAHGGEHIVPHRATGSPTIIRIELDREVLAQAVLGDLLRLQGREVTLGLS